MSDELPASARRRRSGGPITSANSRCGARGPIEQWAVSAVRLGGDPMTVSAAFDAAGRRRSPATMPGYHAGRAPRNKGQHYPADPPTVEEIIAVMRQTADDRHGARLRALFAVLWRGGLRIQGALALGERDLDPRRGVAARAPWPSARDGHGRLGLGAADALARRTRRAAGRAAVLHRRRPDARPILVERRRPG